MISKFKIFTENITTDNNNNLKIDYNNDSNVDINTKFGKGNFILRKKTLPNSKIITHSVYLKNPGPDATNILKALKKYPNSANIIINPKDYDDFIKRTAIFLNRFLKKESIDTIFTVESGSNLIRDLLDKIINISSDKNIKIYYSALKKDTSDIKILNKPKKMSDLEYNNLIKSVDKIKNNFHITDIFGRNRKLVTNWIKVEDYAIKKITNKNVIIFDDILTTGSTLDTACSEILKYNPNKLTAITILK